MFLAATFALLPNTQRTPRVTREVNLSLEGVDVVAGKAGDANWAAEQR
jgi:hypothetical protein